ncbi:MAG: bifunctional DNA-formamidopyrimidine glycosylase/DNA-(apurinic or apyrimidinic site) lyase [Legionella sp.]
MPELPEVETTACGIKPFLINQYITGIVIRQPKLRLPVNPETDELCRNKKITAIYRRAKYIIIQLCQGNLILHLGMSGHLRMMLEKKQPQKHDHIDLTIDNGSLLRYTDPRRFGLWLYTADTLEKHPLLVNLGPEPLSADFNPEYLWRRAFGKKQNIKSYLMDNTVVVGIGNIYATESLFIAGIHPLSPAGLISLETMDRLTTAIKNILRQAIAAGGTTLRDFYAADGKPGYFSFALNVYGRKGEPCLRCTTTIESMRIAGRNSYFCPRCQLF